MYSRKPFFPDKGRIDTSLFQSCTMEPSVGQGLLNLKGQFPVIMKNGDEQF